MCRKDSLDRQLIILAWCVRQLVLGRRACLQLSRVIVHTNPARGRLIIGLRLLLVIRIASFIASLLAGINPTKTPPHKKSILQLPISADTP